MLKMWIYISKVVLIIKKKWIKCLQLQEIEHLDHTPKAIKGAEYILFGYQLEPIDWNKFLEFFLN